MCPEVFKSRKLICNGTLRNKHGTVRTASISDCCFYISIMLSYLAIHLPTNKTSKNIPYNGNVYVVGRCYPWFNFDFPLFFSMLIYDNEYKTK